MVELGYVKKRKRRKAIGIISAVASAGMSTLILVSFLGRFVGSFTISLNTGNVKLSISDKEAFSSSSTFLKVDSLPPFGQATFTQIPLEMVDSAEYTYLSPDLRATVPDPKNPEIIRSLNFFKYTFFIRNIGTITAEYYMSIRINESVPSADGRYLDSMLRVMVFENGVSSGEHNYTVYAQESDEPHYLDDGEVTYKEYISYSREQCDDAGYDFPGYAEPFENSKSVATIPVKYFDRDNVKRYTIVTWIEGWDPQAINNAPTGASLKLGVEINAYENKE